MREDPDQEGGLRAAEWISVGFFAVFLLAGVIVPLGRRERRNAIGIGAAGILAAGALQFLAPSAAAALLRDLIPGLFLLMAYWQAGQFFRGGHPRLQGSLDRIEARWFPGVLRLSSTLERRPIISTYLEAAYLMCYPVVPLGVVALYLADQREVADPFWRVVLPASFVCYACTALFHALPPRLVEPGSGAPRPASRLRSLNLWVLRHGSIHANTIPSGHVANSFAIALVLLEAIPLVGALFLWVSGSITVATAVLRYHYSIDAVLGIGVALLSYALMG